MGLERYKCPYCGTAYKHDKGYIHTVQECQKKERAKGPKA